MPQTDIQKRLFELQDKDYGAFSAKLIPHKDPDCVIGVRLPELRKLAKQLRNTPEAAAFLQELPHRYLEEDHLQSFLIAGMQDFDECIAAVERFLPFVDNWATCDSLRPACFKKHKQELLKHIKVWLQSEQLYTARFGIGMLMCHFLEEDFQEEYLQWVADVKSEEYYVNMMRAWYFATALAKQYERTLVLIESGSLDSFTHNKTIQKACESFRVSDAHKQYLKTLKKK